MHPPFFDSDAPDYDPWDASRDPYYDWERIDDDPYMMDGYDAVAAHDVHHAPPGPPEPEYPYGYEDDHPYGYEDEHDYHAARHKKKKKKHHHHDESSSSTSEESTTTTITSETSITTTSETSTTTTSETITTITTTSETSTSETSTSSNSASLTSIATTAAQRNAVEASSLSESPILISSASFRSSDDATATPTFSDEDDLTIVSKVVHAPATSYVVSTVYAVNTMMPGSYPNIDYNAIDYSQLGQIGVFADSAQGLNVAAYWMSLAVALMVVFMLRV